MKPYLFLGLLFGTFGNPNIRALDTARIAQYQNELSDPSAEVRLAAMKDLRNVVRPPQGIDADVVALATSAMTDPDSRVRYSAVTLVTALATETMPAQGFLPPGSYDLRSYLPLKDGLQQAMADSNTETRKNALGAYVFLFKLSPEMEHELITRFESEDDNNKDGIVAALIVNGDFSVTITNFLLRLLEGTKFDYEIASNLRSSLFSPPPPALLPKLAEKLAQARDTPHKEAFAAAMSKYGGEAKPYLNMIEQMEGKEGDN